MIFSGSTILENEMLLQMLKVIRRYMHQHLRLDSSS